MKRHPRHFRWVVLVCSLLLAAPAAAATTATWVDLAGNDSWSDAANWDVGDVPCNAGVDAWDVVIPAAAGPVRADAVACEVDTLSLGTGSTLRLASGGDLTVLGAAAIEGAIDGDGGDLTASNGSFPGSAAWIDAALGSTTTIGAASYSSIAHAAASFDVLSAEGTGTAIDLSSLTAWNAGFNDASGYERGHFVRALDGGSIDLQSLQSLTLPVRGEDYVEFDLATGGSVDLRGLTTLPGAGGWTMFDVHAGSGLDLPMLQTVADTTFNAEGGGQITIGNGPAVSYSATGFNWRAGTFRLFRADGATSFVDASKVQTIDVNPVSGSHNVTPQIVASGGGAVNLSGVTTLNAAIDDATGYVSQLQILSSGAGSSIDLRALTDLTLPLDADEYVEVDLAGGGSVDLSLLATIPEAGGYTRFDVHGGSLLDLPALSSAADTLFFADSDGDITVNTTAGAGWSTVGMNWGSFDIAGADGAGSVVDLSSVTTLDAGFDDASGYERGHFLRASNGGTVNLQHLQSLTAPARAEDYVELELAGGGSFVLTDLATLPGAGGWTMFDVHAGSSLDLPSLQAVEDALFNAEGGGQITINSGPGVSYAATGLDWRAGTYRLFRADGATSRVDASKVVSIVADPASGGNNVTPQIVASNGGAVDLSGVTALHAAINDATGYVSRFQILSSGTGSSVDLRALTDLTLPLDADEYVEIDLSGGGTVDLSSLATIPDTGGYTQLDVHGGSLLDLPALTGAGDVLFLADGGGEITVNTTTGADWSTIGMNWGSFDIARADGADSVVDLSSVTLLDAGFDDASGYERGHFLRASGGGIVNLQHLQTLTPPARAEDYVELELAGGGSFVLTDLATLPGAGGWASFDVGAGSSLDLPALQMVEDAIFNAEGGGQITINSGPAASYASTGLSWRAGTYPLFRADGAGSLVDASKVVTIIADPAPGGNNVTPQIVASGGGAVNLSGVTALDAAIDDTAGYVSSFEILSAGAGSSVDLRALTDLTLPLDFDEYLEVDLSDGGVVDLSSLVIIPDAGGYTTFDVHGGSLLDLPALTHAADARFLADGGGQITVDTTSDVIWSTVDLDWADVDIARADGSGSVVDLSGVTTLDAGFDDASGYERGHFVRASNNGSIDLGNLRRLTLPARSEDSVQLVLSQGGSLDLGSLEIVSGPGQLHLTAGDQSTLTAGRIAPPGLLGISISTGSGLVAGDLLDSPSSTTDSFVELNDTDVTFDLSGSLDLGADVTLTVVEAETTLSVERHVTHAHIDEARVQLESAILRLDGAGPQLIETAGDNLGPDRPVVENFGIGQLVVGPAGPTSVRWVDDRNNGNRGPANEAEAIYLLGLDAATTNIHGASGLRLLNGSTLNLACIDTYVCDDDGTPSCERLNDRFAGPPFDAEPYDGGFLQLDRDSDGDAHPDCRDNCPRVANSDQADEDGDGIGDVCVIEIPLDEPEVSDILPTLELASETGASVAAAGDLNGDGIRDVLIGAPSYDTGATPVEVGAVGVFLGAAGMGARTTPDILFVGENAHDRAGVSVAGDFDFNGDGRPDILIGAEQLNRTGVDDPTAGCDTDAPCGNGRAYLIFFDPADYPSLGDSDVIDVIDLADVGVSIPGVVFDGAAFGDRAGFAVAGGGRFNAGTGDDIAIGAPGRDVTLAGTRVDAGAVYVIFDDPALGPVVDLASVAGGPLPVAGVLYEGEAAGDHLGHAVAFPGDVVGDGGDDLVMGAPGSDVGAIDAGSVYIPPGGSELMDISETGSIGDSKGGNHLVGVQFGEGLGSSVAGGGDSLFNGQDDLLIGAPLYDSDAEVDAGRVLHIASKLPEGIFAADLVGAPANDPRSIEGVIYVGAAAGDQVGFAVAGLGDVTGNGRDDVAFGAPFADPRGVLDAGTVYLVEGFVPPAFDLGTVDLSQGFWGVELIGTNAGEHAGSALAGVGDLNADGENDYVIGAPGYSSEDGRAYLVLEQPSYSGDQDADGIADPFDNCVAMPNPTQLDTDGDGPGDGCDNCPAVFNPSQNDDDDDGTGDACDTDPVVVISSRTEDNPDFPTIQAALDAAGESGTTIRLLFGDDGTYVENVVANHGLLFHFEGGEDGICIDGGSGIAFDLLSSSGSSPIEIRNLCVMGQVGLHAVVNTHLQDVDFRNIGLLALDLDAPLLDATVVYEADHVTMDQGVVGGIDTEAGTELHLSRSTLQGITGDAMVVAGHAEIVNTLIAQCGSAIHLVGSGTLSLRHATVADSVTGAGVTGAVAATVAHSILWANAAGDLPGVVCDDVSWSIVCDCPAGNNNMCADPLFVGGGDYHLQPGSPALDRGEDPALYDGDPCTDLDDGRRLRDHDGDGLAVLDVGAYENENTTLTPGRVMDLRFLDDLTLEWDAEPSADAYHVYRDTLALLGYGHFGSCVDGEDPDRTDTVFVDTTPVAAGTGVFYVISAADSSNPDPLLREGSLGLARCTERSNFNPCP